MRAGDQKLRFDLVWPKHVFVTVESLTKSRLLRDIGPG